MSVQAERGLKFSRWSGALVALAAQDRLSTTCTRVAQRLEGGPFFSGTTRIILERYYGVTVGAYSYGPCLHPGAFPSGVTVGRYVSMATGVLYAQRNHPPDRLSMHPFFYAKRYGLVAEDNVPRGTLSIGHDAWIGARVFITASCRRIGVGAVVGACSVVTKDVDDFAIVAGNPARLIRYRFDLETIRLILASRWWERTLEELTPHAAQMVGPLTSAAQHPLLNPQHAKVEAAACV